MDNCYKMHKNSKYDFLLLDLLEYDIISLLYKTQSLLHLLFIKFICIMRNIKKNELKREMLLADEGFCKRMSMKELYAESPVWKYVGR